jgi:hypothetical protein
LADVSDQSVLKDFFSSNDPVIKEIYSREPSTVCYILDSKTAAIFGIIGFFITAVILALPVS